MARITLIPVAKAWNIDVIPPTQEIGSSTIDRAQLRYFATGVRRPLGGAREHWILARHLLWEQRLAIQRRLGKEGRLTIRQRLVMVWRLVIELRLVN